MQLFSIRLAFIFLSLLLFSSPAKSEYIDPSTIYVDWFARDANGNPTFPKFSTIEEAAKSTAKSWCPFDTPYVKNCTYIGLRASDLTAGVSYWDIGNNQPATIFLMIGGEYYCPTGYTLMFATHLQRWTCFRPDPLPPEPPLKAIVIDPGHGFSCAALKEKIGAVGYTDFPPNNPPAGRLREDNLTVAIALEAEKMLAKNYRVVLTKVNVNTCLTLKERRTLAQNEYPDAFVSVHINSAYTTKMGIEIPLLGDIDSGTSVYYHISAPYSKPLADMMASTVSSNLGLSNRGSKTADFAVIKPYPNKMPAVLLETARLIGTDEKILHTPGSATKAANGIKDAIISIIGK